jgi:septal ring factor EnvC (AmiA/AmiB activator)
MNLKSISKGLIVSSLIFGSTLFLTDCTSKITQEQLQELQELKRRESSLNDKIAEINAELAKLREQLKSIKNDLNKCNEDKAFVEEKLKNWPDVWPDWSPNQNNK